MDADQFITELALDILDGRSFDISGRKCRYQQLFPAFDFLENVSVMICRPGMKLLTALSILSGRGRKWW